MRASAAARARTQAQRSPRLRRSSPAPSRTATDAPKTGLESARATASTHGPPSTFTARKMRSSTGRWRSAGVTDGEAVGRILQDRPQRVDAAAPAGGYSRGSGRGSPGEERPCGEGLRSRRSDCTRGDMGGRPPPPAAAWLDLPAPPAWNKPGAKIPPAPRFDPDPFLAKQCAGEVRAPASDADRAVGRRRLEAPRRLPALRGDRGGAGPVRRGRHVPPARLPGLRLRGRALRRARSRPAPWTPAPTVRRRCRSSGPPTRVAVPFSRYAQDRPALLPVAREHRPVPDRRRERRGRW